MTRPDCVIVTRPEPAASALCTQLQSANITAIHLPVLAIQPGLTLLPLETAKQIIADADMLIITSQHTIPFLHTLSPPNNPTHIMTIGASTAQALQQLTWPVHYYPQKANSEALLEANMLATRVITGKRIALIKGAGGRNLLAPSLTARGAIVTEIDVYQRVPVNYEHTELKAITQHGALITITSVDIFKQLCALFQFNLEWLYNQILLVTSKRIATLVREQSSAQIIECEDANNAAILRAIQDRLGKQHE